MGIGSASSTMFELAKGQGIQILLLLRWLCLTQEGKVCKDWGEKAELTQVPLA